MIMRPQWYCDAMPLTLGGDTGISGPMLRSRMLGLLHGVFAKRPGTFAVAFPGREQLPTLPLPLTGTLRVFASSREDLDGLAKNVISQPWFRDCLIRRPSPMIFAGIGCVSSGTECPR